MSITSTGTLTAASKTILSRSQSFPGVSSVSGFSYKEWLAELPSKSSLWESVCDRKHSISESDRRLNAQKEGLKPSFSRQYAGVCDLLNLADFNREFAVDTAKFWKFLETTQSDQLDQLRWLTIKTNKTVLLPYDKSSNKQLIPNDVES